MNFEGVNDAVVVVGDVAAVRSSDRLFSAKKLSKRYATPSEESDELMSNILQQQQPPTPPVTQRTLLLYSRPTEPMPMSDELPFGLQELPLSSPHPADGARFVPFSVNSLRFCIPLIFVHFDPALASRRCCFIASS